MTTDYLGTLFPPYTLTEDTEVVSFKRYFRKESGGYSPVLDSLSTDNPKLKGWYEFKSNHCREFKHNVESLCVNNVADQCHSFLLKLQKFPTWTLPRSTTMEGGVVIDWTGTFTDTKWEETIGQLIVPDYAVPFSTNLYFAMHVNELLKEYSDAGATKLTTAGWTALKPTLQAFNDAIVAGSGVSYLDYGYTFDPTTLTSVTRTADVYTLASYWEDVDFRVILGMLQDSLKFMSSLSGVDDQKTYVTNMITALRNAARTMCDIAMRTNNLEIISMKSTTVSVCTIPGTMTVDSVTYYRLNSKKQLVNGETYGLLVRNNDGSLEILDPQTVANPTTKFDSLDLPEYSVYIPTDEIEIPIAMIHNKKIWFTTVPFTGA